VITALVLCGVTTVFCAWRWRLVASALGLELSLRTAISAYYKSQFLNTALPGGVLGDVHRAVVHGRDSGGRLKAARAVVWERLAGQIVQIALAAIVVALLPSPVPAVVPLAAAGVVVAVIGGAVLLGRRTHGRQLTGSRIGRLIGVVGADMRCAVLARHAWPGIVLTSSAVVVGHVAMFFVAARTAGLSVSFYRLLPLAMLILVAMALPANIGGWGVREGAAAWAFGAAGLGAAQGLATATVFGVLVMVATLPGAVLLLAPHILSSRRAPCEVSAGAPDEERTEHLEPVGVAAAGSVRG
jgi:uncharacterized membrane protein YbhN (UPF0104 family)